MPTELRKRKDREFAAAFGANLARLRLAAGLSQEALGFESDVHRTQVGKIERGEEIGRADTALKLAIGLGISLDELFAGISWAPPTLTRGHPVFVTGSGFSSTAAER